MIRNRNFMSWALAVLWGEKERMTKGPRAGLEGMPGGRTKGGGKCALRAPERLQTAGGKWSEPVLSNKGMGAVVVGHVEKFIRT